MLFIRPTYSFDLNGIPPDLMIRVKDRVFPVHRLVLINQSDYFRKLLTSGFRESSQKEIVLQEICPEYFELILQSIYGKKFEIFDFETSLSYLLLLNFFQVRGIEIPDFEVPSEKFPLYVNYLNRISPDGIDPDLLASKLQPDTDLSFLNPEMKTAIKFSPEIRYFGRHNKLVQQMYRESQRFQDSPLKYYLIMDELIKARSLTEAILKFRQNEYHKTLKMYINDIIDHPNYTHQNPKTIQQGQYIFTIPPRRVKLQEFQDEIFQDPLDIYNFEDGVDVEEALQNFHRDDFDYQEKIPL